MRPRINARSKEEGGKMRLGEDDHFMAGQSELLRVDFVGIAGLNFRIAKFWTEANDSTRYASTT